MSYPYINHVMMTLHLMQTSYNELEILFRPRRKEEIGLINSSVIQNYVLSLHYMFVNEFCKLFENPGRNTDQNVASLLTWNDFLYKIHVDDFEQTWQQNLNILNEIKTSELFKTIKTYRDRRFSHIDGKSTNPFTIPVLEDGDMTALKIFCLNLKS